MTSVIENKEKYPFRFELEKKKVGRPLQKIRSKVLLVRVYDDQLNIFELYKKAGVKSKSDVLRLLIDTHEILRILLRNSDANFKIKNQDEWSNEDWNTYYKHLEIFKKFEDKLQLYIQNVIQSDIQIDRESF